MDKQDLLELAAEYEKVNEPELARICEKSARFLEEKEKHHAERSA